MWLGNPYNESNNYIVGLYAPAHSLGATHCFMVSSITVPFGHSHPLTIQTAGQATGSVVLHVWWQSGCEAHSFLICPLMGQAEMNYYVIK